MKSQESYIQTLEILRKNLIVYVNNSIDAAIEELGNSPKTPKAGSLIMPFEGNASYFKGKKPMSVILPDDSEKVAPTWKKVVEIILLDCASSKKGIEYLKNGINRISGKTRTLLASSPQGMGQPIKIENGIYFESKYDTETLLKVITDRVLKPIGYPYSKLQINIRA